MEPSLRVVHIGAEWETRAIVEISLLLDSAFMVSGATSAVETLAMLGDDGPAPDILLMDDHIEGTSGIDLLNTIRRDPRWSRIPVAFLTTRAMTRDVDTILEAGALGMLTKPFNPLTLAQEVRAMLSH